MIWIEKSDDKNISQFDISVIEDVRMTTFHLINDVPDGVWATVWLCFAEILFLDLHICWICEN